MGAPHKETAEHQLHTINNTAKHAYAVFFFIVSSLSTLRRTSQHSRLHIDDQSLELRVALQSDLRHNRLVVARFASDFVNDIQVFDFAFDHSCLHLSHRRVVVDHVTDPVLDHLVGSEDGEPEHLD